jgi:hypothetical protein
MEDYHLYFVITDPVGNPQEVALVNLTSYRPNIDDSAVFDVADHPNITQKSMINYAGAQVAPVESLQMYVTANPRRLKPSCSPKMLQTIRDGFWKTDATAKKMRTFCDGLFKSKFKP